MSLKSSLAKLQRRGARFYLELAEQFSENTLIRESWQSMARDMEQLADSLQTIPARFWVQLNDAEGVLEKTVRESPDPGCLGLEEGRSMHGCFDRMLRFEEPVTLKVYAPLIHRLRTESRGHALDFYIIVKAHIAHLIRLVQPFSGDPSFTQNAQRLLEAFEHEVQAPELPPSPAATKVRRAAARKSLPKTATRSAQKASRTVERAKKLARHSKPLVGKIEIRRRARG
jgi:hypothetical protein